MSNRGSRPATDNGNTQGARQRASSAASSEGAKRSRSAMPSSASSEACEKRLALLRVTQR
jgi:hypothetical protein